MISGFRCPDYDVGVRMPRFAAARSMMKGARHGENKIREGKAGRPIAAGRSRCAPPRPAPGHEITLPRSLVLGLDAAAIALEDAGRPLNCSDLILIMVQSKLWKSPNGKTPEATLYAAITREIKNKGDAARFYKVGRGLFALNRKEETHA